MVINTGGDRVEARKEKVAFLFRPPRFCFTPPVISCRCSREELSLSKRGGFKEKVAVTLPFVFQHPPRRRAFMPPAISKGNSSALVPPLPTCCTPTILLRSLCPVTLPPLVQPTTPHVVVLPSASETERKEAAAPPTMGSNQDSRRDVMKNRYVETIIRATEKMLESDHKTDPNELEKKIQRLRAQRLRLNRTKAIATVQESRKKIDTSKRKIEIEVLREATRQKLREVEKDARLHPLWPTIPWNTLLELGLVTKSGEHIYFISKPKKKKRSFLSKNEKIIVTETRGEIEQGEIIMMESSDDIEKGEIV